MLPPRRAGSGGPRGARNSVERLAIWLINPLAIIRLVVSLLEKAFEWLPRSRTIGRRRANPRRKPRGGTILRAAGRIILIGMVLVATPLLRCKCGRLASGGAPAKEAATKEETRQVPHGASIAGPLGTSSCGQTWLVQGAGLQPELPPSRRRQASSHSSGRRRSQQRRRRPSSPSCRSAMTRAASRWEPSMSPPCGSASSFRSLA